MKKIFFLAMLLMVALFSTVSCSQDDTLLNEKPTTKGEVVSFHPSFPSFESGMQKSPLRIQETNFEKNDEIGVFAVDASKSSTLKATNYADNVCYRYNGSSFSSVGDGITISDAQTQGLAYYAVYPYFQNAGATASFTVKSDQRKHDDYSLSDLCTAFASATSSTEVDLTFSHRLTNILVELQGENIASKTITVRASNVQRTVQMNLNANTFTANGNKGDIQMNATANNSYQCIVAPQTIEKDAALLVITVDGKEQSFKLGTETTLKSGNRYTYQFEVKNDGKVVAISGSINPWNNGGSDTPGSDDNPQAEKMESDPALEVYVTAAERIGNNLIIDYSIKNVSGKDLNNFYLYYTNMVDNLNNSTGISCAIDEGEYMFYTQTITKLRNGATVLFHMKGIGFDPTNKAKSVSIKMDVYAENHEFSTHKIDFYIDKVKDNRPLSGGIQTCDRKLKFTLTKCTLDKDGNAIVDFTVQNLTSDNISGFKIEGTNEGVDDLSNNFNCYTSINGSVYGEAIWDEKETDLPAQATIKGSIKAEKPAKDAKKLTFNIGCTSSNCYFEESCIRFVTIPIQ